MEYVKLEEICTIVSGGTPSRSKPNYWNNGNIPWIKIKDMKSKYIDSAEEFITEEGLNNSSTKMLKSDTILYSIFATLGEVGILKIDACTNQAIAGLSLKEDSNILKEYLYYYLKSKKKDVNNLGRGVAQNNINLSLLRKFKIPVMPLHQQEKIVEVLDNVSSTMNNYERELELLDELVKARFVEMFGDPNIEFKYNSVKFSDLAVRMTKGPFGSDMKKDLFVPKGEDTYKVYIQINAIQKDQTLGEYYISKEYFDRKVSRFELFPNDYIITCDGTLGKYLKLDENMEKGVISPSLLRLTLQNDKINDKYFENIWDFYMLGLMKKEARNACLVHLPSAKKIGEISIPLPPLELQNQFASFVEEIDKSRLLNICLKSLMEFVLKFRIFSKYKKSS